MANTPNKVKDPTEVALSAIQETLNMSDGAVDTGRTSAARAQTAHMTTPPKPPAFHEAPLDTTPFGTEWPVSEPIEEPHTQHHAANDDREAIGHILQVLHKGRPGRSVYTFASLFAGVWLAGCGALTYGFLTSLQDALGQSGGVLVVGGLVAMFFAPVALFYFLASLAGRGQEMRLIAQAMAQVAIRFSEPEALASDSMVTVGQAVRREVAAMGDGVERAIARAGELEMLVANEVAALERAYTDNEVRIRALLQDIAHQRDHLVGQAEHVRSAISEVQADLRQDIAFFSEALESRVDEVAKSITSALEERGAHITHALSNAGDNMILALGERGGDLLDRLEHASSETTRAVLDASERLTAVLNFKTGHVDEEFADLADRIHEMLTERINSVADEFEQRSVAIVDGVSERTEQVHDSLKNSGDSLLLELDLRSNDLSTKIDEASNRLSNQIVTSGDKAGEALNDTVNTLVTKVMRQSETAHDSLSLQMNAFQELVTNQGSVLAEKFARDSGSLGALITRHISEFDHTVKTFGGDIVDRMGQRTEALVDTLKTCIDTLETRFSSNSGDIAAALDQRLTKFEVTIDERVINLDLSLDGKIVNLDTAIGGHIKTLNEQFGDHVATITQAFDERANSVTETFENRLGTLATSLTDSAAQSIEAVDRYITSATEMIDGRSARLTDTITARFQEIHQAIETKAGSVADDVGMHVAQFEDLLGSRIEAAASRIESSGNQVSNELTSRAEMISTAIRSHVEDAERTLTNLVVNTSETIQAGAHTAQQSLMTVSTDINAQLKLVSSEVERALTAVGTGAANSIVVSARDAQLSLVSASSDAADQIKALASDVQQALSLAGITAADTLTTSAREAQTTLTASSADAVSQIRAISTEVEQSLGTASANATSDIQTAAITAQTALLSASTEASLRVKSSSADIEQSVLAATGAFGSTMTAKTNEIVAHVQQQTDQLSNLIDSKGGVLVDAIGAKIDQLTTDIDRATSGALESIETRSLAFSQSMLDNSNAVVRTVNLASESAAGSINKSLTDIEQASRTAIEQSRQASIAAVTEMQETNTILRTDTVTLFERLREGNILLQEVLTGAHDNLDSLERALVSRVADFVSAMNDVNTRNGAATQMLERQLDVFNAKTKSALDDLGQLSAQFDAHGKMLVDAAAMVELSNRNTTASLTERKQTLESLVTTIDHRTDDLSQRLSRFTGLLDESLAAADERARDIARVVAETASSGSSTITRQFDAVRAASEAKHRQTVEAMHDIYQQATSEADTMFKQSAEKFANLVVSMKQMALEMHNELEATRNELRRGVLEMPQEAAESTAQMRKLVVDQIEALAELNRIVAQHGRGLDVATERVATERVATDRQGIQHQEEPRPAAAVSRNETRMRDSGSGSASSLPPMDLGMPAPRLRTEAPPVSLESSDQGRNGWLSDLLNRANSDPLRGAPQEPQAPRGGGNPLESLSLDIGRLMDRNLAGDMWDRYQRGENKVFTKRLYTGAGQKAFDEVSRKYRTDRNFKQTVDRYITEFERLLDEITHDGRHPQDLRSHLTSETGLVYTLLAQAAGRLG